jgi:hypothetical protein
MCHVIDLDSNVATADGRAFINEVDCNVGGGTFAGDGDTIPG